MNESIVDQPGPTEPQTQTGRLTLPGLRVGNLAHRDKCVLKNGRWYLIDTAGHQRIGWGDLSDDDLRHIHTVLAGALFIGVLESPNHSRGSDYQWEWYDRPDPTPGPTLHDVCAAAGVAVLAEGGPVMVTAHRRLLGETSAFASRWGLGAIAIADLHQIATGL